VMRRVASSKTSKIDATYYCQYGLVESADAAVQALQILQKVACIGLW